MMLKIIGLILVISYITYGLPNDSLVHFEAIRSGSIVTKVYNSDTLFAVCNLLRIAKHDIDSLDTMSRYRRDKSDKEVASLKHDISEVAIYNVIKSMRKYAIKNGIGYIVCRNGNGFCYIDDRFSKYNDHVIKYDGKFTHVTTFLNRNTRATILTSNNSDATVELADHFNTDKEVIDAVDEVNGNFQSAVRQMNSTRRYMDPHVVGLLITGGAAIVTATVLLLALGKH